MRGQESASHSASPSYRNLHFVSCLGLSREHARAYSRHAQGPAPPSNLVPAGDLSSPSPRLPACPDALYLVKSKVPTLPGKTDTTAYQGGTCWVRESTIVEIGLPVGDAWMDQLCPVHVRTCSWPQPSPITLGTACILVRREPVANMVVTHVDKPAGFRKAVPLVWLTSWHLQNCTVESHRRREQQKGSATREETLPSVSIS